MLPSPSELEAERLRRSLRAFIRAAWPVIEPATPFRSNWHIDAIADHLEAATRGEIRKLVINIPPRHMKTLGVAVFWPAWVWLTSPERRFLYASYAERLSVSHSVVCRRLIQSEGIRLRPGEDGSERTLLERVGYRGLVELIAGPEAWELTADQNVKGRFDNTRTGFRLATSVGGSVAGEGGDVTVLDDPHKPDEVESDAVRESVIDWYDSTWTTRLNDAAAGVQVIIMQRLHERDLTGHVLARGGFDHLCLPAEYEASHPFTWPDDPRKAAGEVLWEEKWPEQWLAEKQTELGSYRYAGQYQQRPAPEEGGIVKRAWWRYYEPPELPELKEIVQSWDMAFKAEEGSDYVVCQIWGRDLAKKYLLHQLRERLEFTEVLHRFEEMTAWVEERFPERRSHVKLVEDKANGPAVISYLRNKVSGIIAINPKNDKAGRLRSVAPEIESGNVYLPGRASVDGKSYDRRHTPRWVQEFVEECAAFPRAAHDDQVDALSQALSRLAGSGGRPWRQRNNRERPITAGLMNREF